ncbi:unnamed protein product [Caenorhabditis auriculariae]|uniref:Uncharacterized protein n=1 Tax=Caenorhabditis auriculariae TaxID=2777116 RepID=A0A8S1H1X5_9PELO|nr:unnamed protein product [Caenorhabditis auriculariae]
MCDTCVSCLHGAALFHHKPASWKDAGLGRGSFALPTLHSAPNFRCPLLANSHYVMRLQAFPPSPGFFLPTPSLF